MPDAVPRDPIAVVRERLRSLAASHAAGTLDDVSYEAARREAERALGDAVLAGAPLATDAASIADPAGRATRPARSTRPSLRLVLTTTIAVVAIAIVGYAFKGSPSLAGLGVPPPPAAGSPGPNAAGAPDSERAIGLQQIAAMVDQLAERLKTRPDDAEGWTMLARSYTVLMRYRDALPAYRHAVELQPKNAALLADFSDATAAANGGKADADSIALLDRALAIDPSQPKALALAGTIAFDRGDYAAAIAQWQKIADALPPDSEFHQQVIANIDEARRRAGLPASPKVATNPAPSTAPSNASTTTSTNGREALTGVVTLAPALAAQAAPTDTVFVLARPEGGRMPLAVFRATVKDLPLRFRLDDSMAMTPTMKISDMKEVVVAARVSRSGNAISQPGDLAGESKPVAPGTTDLAIVVTTVVPPQ